jgi:glycosyltransferase involved in cell wall biosynthesis
MAFTSTIIVPVFNTEDYLRGCLQSLLDQTHKQFEIIVVDDCSPGPCESIVNDFRQVRPDIKYVRHPENLGLLVARFTGALNSSGDYVGYLDSDDKARPTFVEMLLASANKTGADIIGSLNPLSEVRRPEEFQLKGSKALFEAYVNKDIQNYNVWTKLYRRELLLSLTDLVRIAKKQRMDSPEDLLINVFYGLKEPSYVNVPHILVEYNETRSGSLTNLRDDGNVMRDLRGRLDAYHLLRTVAGEHAPLVEQLIQRSSNYIYRRKMVAYSKSQFEKFTEYLVQEDGGPIILSYMLNAAETDRRALKAKLEKLKRTNLHLKTLRGAIGTILNNLGLCGGTMTQAGRN